MMLPAISICASPGWGLQFMKRAWYEHAGIGITITVIQLFVRYHTNTGYFGLVGTRYIIANWVIAGDHGSFLRRTNVDVITSHVLIEFLLSNKLNKQLLYYKVLFKTRSLNRKSSRTSRRLYWLNTSGF